jgi:hypothetical protein
LDFRLIYRYEFESQKQNKNIIQQMKGLLQED